MTIDRATLGETAYITDTTGLSAAAALELARRGDPAAALDAAAWKGHARVDKFWADDDPARATPYETVEAENLLLTAGATLVLQRLCGVASTALDLANARLCVGDGTAAVAVGQTDLQGANKFRKALDAAPTIGTTTAQFVATFITTEANFAWQEAGVANSASGATLLDRFLQSFGTKTSALQWTLTITLSLS